MAWKYKLRSLFSKRLDLDLDDELQAHLEMRTEELQAGGLTPREAQLEARRRFGNPTLIRESTRDAHIFTSLETLWQDAVYAVRLLAREKAFTIAALLTLALGIGANGAIFSLIEAALVRPLPLPHSDQLAILFGTSPGSERNSLAVADLADFRKARSFTGLAAMQSQSVNLTGVEQPSRVIGGFVSAGYFQVLSVPPLLGRTFAPEDDEPNAANTVVLGFAFWQNRLGADPNVLGKKLFLNNQPATVIGVMPAAFQMPVFTTELWLPAHLYPNYAAERSRTCFLGLARLAAGVSLRQAQAETDTIAAQLQRAYPASNQGRGAVLLALRDIVTQDLRPKLWVLGAAVVCLLLIACANISGLLIARASGRRQELAVRSALGASNLRLTQQMLTESVILALGGAVLGLGVALALAKWLSINLFGWPNGVETHLNLPLMAFLILAAMLVGIFFGAGPALFARRSSLALRERGSDRGRSRFRNALVATQIAVAFVLLAAAGLLGTSLRRLLGVDPGFDGRHVLTLEYRLPANKYGGDGPQMFFHNQVLQRVRALPGVESAGIVRGVPFSGNGESAHIGLPDRPDPPANAPFQAFYNAATPGYLQTVRVPLLAGRSLQDSDNFQNARVILVNEAFVKRYWPNVRALRDVLGRQVLVPGRDAATAAGGLVPATIVGVVGDVKQEALTDPFEPEIYASYAQDPMTFATLAVRTQGDPMLRVKDVQRAIWSLDPDQPMWKVRSLDYLVERTTGNNRLMLTLLLAFSSLSLLLAALGIYGLIAYQVSQRTAEFGVRIALGAGPADLLSLMLRQAVILTLFGLAAGIALLPAAADLLRSELYDVRINDPLVYLPMLAVLASVSLATAAIPAWRATRIDPVRALRRE